VMRETIKILRLLWTGEKITWQGKRFSLKNAKMIFGGQDIPIWMAVRGEKMLRLAGEISDGAMLMFQSDLGPAIDIVESGRKKGKPRPQRIFLERLAYTPEMLSKTTNFYAHVVMDMPERQLCTMLKEEEIAMLKDAYQKGGPAAVTELVTPDMIRRYKVSGTPEECRQTMSRLIHEHELDMYLSLITEAGLDANILMMRDTLDIIRGAEKAS
jgi:alkanesulfonate monooxygenase SsuD/methylene tetrahydromethanopterin reductase-like flavin-dependent oxidoreductase (luciferase family)